MNLASNIPDFDAPVVEHARKDFPLLDADMTVGEALERIRREGVGERVIYFYAIDEEKRLVGVVPDPAPADRATGNRAARSDGAARRGCSGEGNGARRVRVLRALQISRIPGRG
jgi:CBS domain-containing protein